MSQIDQSTHQGFPKNICKCGLRFLEAYLNYLFRNLKSEKNNTAQIDHVFFEVICFKQLYHIHFSSCFSFFI